MDTSQSQSQSQEQSHSHSQEQSREQSEVQSDCQSQSRSECQSQSQSQSQFQAHPQALDRARAAQEGVTTQPPQRRHADRYTVEHETRYSYSAPVAGSWQLAHLTPRLLPWQRLRSHELLIEPTPDECRDEVDSFGNGVTHFGMHGAHRVLSVRMVCDVDVSDRVAPDPAHDQPWEAVREAVRRQPEHADLEPAQLSEPTHLVPLSDAARIYALPSLAPKRLWLEAMIDLMHRIHADFEFDPGATTVSTSVDEVLHQRRGVCQDFAHLMLACLRGHGLPARYVSGYLLTDPPPGQPRLLGVDASHAWVAAFAPGHGWVEFDPTNDQCADRRYITLAWGADFADVVPLRGVIRGGGQQQMGVWVSVIPTE